MKILTILNDPPYGTEKSHNGLRLALGLAKMPATELHCGSCMDARGLTEEELATAVRRSTMAELAEWSVAADKVLIW